MRKPIYEETVYEFTNGNYQDNGNHHLKQQFSHFQNHINSNKHISNTENKSSRVRYPTTAINNALPTATYTNTQSPRPRNPETSFNYAKVSSDRKIANPITSIYSPIVSKGLISSNSNFSNPRLPSSNIYTNRTTSRYNFNKNIDRRN